MYECEVGELKSVFSHTVEPRYTPTSVSHIISLFLTFCYFIFYNFLARPDPSYRNYNKPLPTPSLDDTNAISMEKLPRSTVHVHALDKMTDRKKRQMAFEIFFI